MLLAIVDLKHLRLIKMFLYYFLSCEIICRVIFMASHFGVVDWASGRAFSYNVYKSLETLGEPLADRGKPGKWLLKWFCVFVSLKSNIS